MNVNKFAEDNGMINIPNPNYNPKSKKNKEPQFIDVPQLTPTTSNAVNMAIVDFNNQWALSATENEKYLKQGVNYSPYENMDLALADAQSNWAKLFNGLAQAVVSEVGLGTIGATADIFDYITSNILHLTEQDYQNPVSNKIKEWQDLFNEKVAPIYVDPDINIQNGALRDWGWYFKNIPNVASTLMLLFPARGITMAAGAMIRGSKLATGIGNARRWATGITKFQDASKMSKLQSSINSFEGIARANKAVEVTADALLMRTAENYQEARETYLPVYKEASDQLNKLNDEQYQELINSNPTLFDPKKVDIRNKDEVAKYIARLSADRTFAMDFSNVIFDIIQLYGLRNMGKAVKELNATRKIRGFQQESIEAAGKVKPIKPGIGIEPPTTTDAATSLSFAEKVGNITKNVGRGIYDFGKHQAKTIAAESTEGIEEAVNYIAQQEGITYGKMLLAGQTDNYTNSYWTAIPRTWTEMHGSLKDYMMSPELQESAFWGVVGGVTFGNIGSIANRAQLAIERKAQEKLRKENEKTGEQNPLSRISQLFESNDTQIARAVINKRLESIGELENKLKIIDSKRDPYNRTETGQNIPFQGDIETKQAIARARAISDFRSELAIDAVNSGTYGLLIDYFKSNEVKQAMINLGLTTENEADAFIQETLNDMEEAKDEYAKQSAHVLNQVAFLNNKHKSGKYSNIDENVSDSESDISQEYARIIAKENYIYARAVKAIDKQIQELGVSQAEQEAILREINPDINSTTAKEALAIYGLVGAYRELDIQERKLKETKPANSIAELQNYSQLKQIEQQKQAILRELKTKTFEGINVPLANVFHAIQIGKLSNKNADGTYILSNSTEEIDKQIIADVRKFFGNEVGDVSDESIISQAKVLNQGINRIINNNKDGIIQANPKLVQILDNINGLEIQRELTRSLIASTSDQVMDRINYLHNVQNKVRATKTLFAESIIAKAIKDYDGVIDETTGESLIPAITAAYEGNRQEAERIANKVMASPGEGAVTASEFMDALDILALHRKSNKALYERVMYFLEKEAKDSAKDRTRTIEENDTNLEQESDTENPKPINPLPQTQNDSNQANGGQNQGVSLQQPIHPIPTITPQISNNNNQQYAKLIINNSGNIVTIKNAGTDNNNGNNFPIIIVDDKMELLANTMTPVQINKLIRAGIIDVDSDVDLLASNKTWEVTQNPIIRNRKNKPFEVVQQGRIEKLEQPEPAQPTQPTPSVEPEITPVETKTPSTSVENSPFKTYKERFNSLINNGILTGEWGNSNGREIVVANVNGIKVLFYKSSSGTDGKTKGNWYPIFGFGAGSRAANDTSDNNWLIKGSIEDMENGYGVPAIQNIQKLLNENFGWEPGSMLNRSQHFVFEGKAKTSEELNKIVLGKEDSGVQNGVNSEQHIKKYLERIKAEEQISIPSTGEVVYHKFDNENLDEDINKAIATEIPDILADDINFDEVETKVIESIKKKYPTISDEDIKSSVQPFIENTKQARDTIKNLDSNTLQLGGLLAYNAKIQDVNSDNFTAPFEAAAKAFLNEYEKLLIVKEIKVGNETRKVVRLEDIMRLVTKALPMSNNEASGFYNIIRNYLIKNQDTYTITDLEKGETVFDNINKTSQEVINQEYNETQEEVRVNIRDIIESNPGDEYFELLDSLKVGDQVHIVLDNGIIYVKSKDKTIGTMALPARDGTKYLQVNQGWMTDVEIDANKNPISQTMDIIQDLFLGKGKDYDELRNLLERLSIKSENITDNDVDSFSINPLISHLAQRAKGLKASNNPRTILNIDKKGNIDFKSALLHLVRLWKFTNTSNIDTDRSKVEDNIKINLALFYKKLYMNYSAISQLQGGEIATISKKVGRHAVKVFQNDTFNNYDQLPLSNDAIVDKENTRIAVGTYNPDLNISISGRPSIYQAGFRPNSTMIALFGGNEAPDFIKAYGVRLNDNTFESNNVYKRIYDATFKHFSELLDGLLVPSYTGKSDITPIVKFLESAFYTNPDSNTIPLFRTINGRFIVEPIKYKTGPGSGVKLVYHAGEQYYRFLIFNTTKRFSPLGFQIEYPGGITELVANDKKALLDAFKTFIKDIVAINIDARGAESDNVTDTNYDGFINRKNGKLIVSIPTKVDDNMFSMEFDSYNNFLIDNNLIRVNTKKSKNGTNFERFGENQKFNPNLVISLPIQTPTNIAPTTEIDTNQNKLEEGTYEEEYNNFVNLFETTNENGKEELVADTEKVLEFMLPEQYKNGLQSVAESEQLQILDLLPSTLYYVKRFNDYTKKNINTQPIASTSGSKDFEILHPYNQGKRGVLKSKGKFKVSIGERFTNMAASSNIGKRINALKILMHENIHNILQAPNSQNRKLLRELTTVYDDFMTLAQEDISNDNISETDRNIIKQLIEVYKKEASTNKALITKALKENSNLTEEEVNRYRHIEEFLVDSLTNSVLYNYLNSKETESAKHNGKPESLLNRIINAICKFFGWNPAKEGTLLMKELNIIRDFFDDGTSDTSTPVEETATTASTPTQTKPSNITKQTETPEQTEEPIIDEDEGLGSLLSEDELNELYSDDNEIDEYYDDGFDDTAFATVADVDNNGFISVGNLSAFTNRLPLDIQAKFATSIQDGSIETKCAL